MGTLRLAHIIWAKISHIEILFGQRLGTLGPTHIIWALNGHNEISSYYLSKGQAH
jgi:hypothetical protein